MAEHRVVGPGRLFVVSAPAGTGKTTVVEEACRRNPMLRRSVSWTTRAPRPGETDGVDYHFVSEAVFKQELEKGGFLESAQHFGARYGTPRIATEQLLGQGFHVILVIDIKGAEQIRDSNIPATFIFIRPPSMQELERRLVRRASESAAALAERLQRSKQELAAASLYDHQIINDRLEEAVQALLAIIAT